MYWEIRDPEAEGTGRICGARFPLMGYGGRLSYGSQGGWSRNTLVEKICCLEPFKEYTVFCTGIWSEEAGYDNTNHYLYDAMVEFDGETYCEGDINSETGVIQCSLFFILI